MYGVYCYSPFNILHDSSYPWFRDVLDMQSKNRVLIKYLHVQRHIKLAMDGKQCLKESLVSTSNGPEATSLRYFTIVRDS